MIFTDDTLVLTKPQLQALAGNTYSYADDRRPNLEGICVDCAGKKVIATNGHCLLAAGLTRQHVDSPRTDGSFILSNDLIAQALYKANKTSVFGVFLEDDEDGDRKVVITRKSNMVYKDKFVVSVLARPRDEVRSEDWERFEAKVHPTASFPPHQHVLPSLDRDVKPTRVIMVGAQYLAHIAAIGRSIPSTIAGGATAEIFMPKRPLEPLAITFEDTTLDVWWIYVVMPRRL